VVGAFFVASIQQYLAAFGAWVSIFQGIIFVVCVLLFRRGIVGEIIALMKPKSAAGAASPGAEAASQDTGRMPGAAPAARGAE
jgi:branched-chain amino acid transport system permease protein